jgi:serine/threonine-protein kinase
VLHSHLEDEATFVDMLRDEARIAARLHHPNVVAIVDLGSHGRQHYVVMDYVEGPSFATLWKRSAERRPLALMLSIVIDTLDGLHSAHTLKDDDGADLNLVHRDVSPQNILVGVDGVARITDFGIAKATSRISSTQPGMRKGKLQFMSPEQVKDEGPIDRRTDVWATGVVLWSMLASEHLFRGETDAATVHNILVKDIVPPSKTKARPPEIFDAVVLKALARNPDERYSSALEMADALRRLASENGLVGSRHDLSQWVEETFKEELERRRQAIREVVRKRTGTPDLSDYSQVTVLPSLPSAISGTEEGSTKSGALPRASSPPTPPKPFSPGEGKGSVSSPPPLELLDALDARELDDGPSRTKRFAIGGAAAIGVALLIALLATRGGSDPQSPEKSGTSTAAKAVVPEVVVAPSAPAAETAPVPSAPRDHAADTDEPTEGRERSSGWWARAASAVRAPAAPPVESRAAFPEPKAPPPVAKAAPAPPAAAPAPSKPAAPPPAKAGGDDFESNPYLRR